MRGTSSVSLFREGNSVHRGQGSHRELISLALVLVLFQTQNAGDLRPALDEGLDGQVTSLGSADEQGSHE